MRFALLALLAALLLAFSGCTKQSDYEKMTDKSNLKIEKVAKKVVQETTKKTNNKEAVNNNSQQNMSMKYQEEQIVLMKTTLGEIRLKLYTPDAPKTVNNFLDLAESGFYNGTLFHRVIKDFMIQGGDPLSKDDDWSKHGTGGPGYAFEDEINKHPLVRGSIAMANSGPNTNGSQFFIVTADATSWLDGKHTNFGEVIDGMEIVEKIESVETDGRDHPLENIEIKSIEIIERI